jgi:hypothetical protein
MLGDRLSSAYSIGMWFERFIIITASLSFGYLPSMWRAMDSNRLGLVDNIFGPFGLFLTLLFIFIRLLPIHPDLRSTANCF